MSSKGNQMYRQNQSSWRQWNQGGGGGSSSSGLMGSYLDSSGNYSDMSGNNTNMSMMNNMQRMNMNSQSLMNNQNMQNMGSFQNMSASSGMSNYSSPPSLMSMNFSSSQNRQNRSMSSPSGPMNLFSSNNQTSLLGNFNPMLNNASSRFNRKDFNSNSNKRMRMDQGRDSNWNRQRNRGGAINRSGNTNRGGTNNRERQDSSTRGRNAQSQSWGRDKGSPKPDPDDTFIDWSLFEDSDKDLDDSDDKYDPASPTEDVPAERVNQNRSSSERSHLSPSPQNSGDLQVTIQHGQKGRAVNKDLFPAKQKIEPGTGQTFRCHACNVPCGTQARFYRHLQSEAHQMIMDKISQQYDQTARQMEARLKAEEHLRKIDGRRKDMSGSEKANYCTVCQVRFTDSLINHRRTKEHKRIREHLYPGCRKCHIKRFPSREAYETHCRSEDHLKNWDDWHKGRGSSNYNSQDDDESQFDPSDFVTVDATGIFEDEMAKFSETGRFPEFNPNNPIGQEVVIPVTGFFCRLCHKFYKEEDSAKINHCQSRSHYDNFKEYKMFKTQQKKNIPKDAEKLEDEVEMPENGVSEVLIQNPSVDDNETVAVSSEDGVTAVQSEEPVATENLDMPTCDLPIDDINHANSNLPESDILEKETSDNVNEEETDF